MPSEKTVLYFAPKADEVSPLVASFGRDGGLSVDRPASSMEVRALLNRTLPACLVLETEGDGADILELVESLKADAFTAIVPVVVIVPDQEPGLSSDLLAVGADEVIHRGLPEREQTLRLTQVLKRADRDVSVHPTTRLPGTNHIARDMQKRLDTGERFAVCYADLDHFKEFNDRYGYAFGDRVIRMLSRILRDMVRGLAPGGFVGHIGGDDFCVITNLDTGEAVAEEIVDRFEERCSVLMEPEDLGRGYIEVHDRQGNPMRAGFPSLTVALVTHQGGGFRHWAKVSDVAAELKAYGKSHEGSIVVKERRSSLDAPVAEAVGTDEESV